MAISDAFVSFATAIIRFAQTLITIAASATLIRRRA
jgi:hypothetical protein